MQLILSTKLRSVKIIDADIPAGGKSMNVASSRTVYFFSILVHSSQFISTNLKSIQVVAACGTRGRQKSLYLKGRRTIILLIACYFFQVPLAYAGNIIENAIVATEPCKTLKADFSFVAVGVDKLEHLRVDEVGIDIRGNHGVVRARVFLVCKTSDGAKFPGKVSANIGLDAELDLLSCQLGRNEIAISDIGGSYGGVVDAFREKISSSLQAGLRGALAKLCQ